ncbi:MAG: adenylate/guanylate cyclase domain-containing protein [Xanthobacteraceae bacterium]|nr:adenylate/guanylate cyclase domain-containing protein [Xanthobacteraceae bacterium]
MDSIRTVIDWLTDGARSAPLSEDVLEELCRRLVQAGIPLWRVAVFVTTLHPDLMGRAFRWWSESGVKVSEAQYDVLETDDYLKSPVVAVYGTRQPLRRRLADPNCPTDFALLSEFRTEGATDYAAFPLLFTDGSIHVATWTTRQPGGFTPEQYADLEQVIAPLTRVAEIRALRRTATNLLNTYVGRQTGEQILAGRIRRGHVEAIQAAIWLSDMRGFTTLSERLPPQDLIDLLNRYFDCQVPAILNRGGEVLKFIGDGLLAIFPLTGGGEDADEVCRRALTCAREAEAAIAALDPPPGDNHDAIRFGLALHIGQVSYGNIGGGNRLDFTCIGPAVNLAARLEKRASSLGRAIVASAEFAAHVPDEFVPLGEFPVAGFAAPQKLFGIKDQSAPGQG